MEAQPFKQLAPTKHKNQTKTQRAVSGHAVRLLSYPDFLERLAERVARLRERFGWLSGSKGLLALTEVLVFVGSALG